MAEKSAASLRDKLMQTMISTAFFSWQSALIIALSIIFFAFNLSLLGMPSWAWLLFGLIGEALFIGATVTDPGAQQRAMERLLQDRYTPEDIQNPAARERLKQALEYYSAIQQLVATRQAASRVEFQHTVDEVDDWIGYLYQLGKRIDQFDENRIINRDRMAARREMDALKKRIKVEPDERVKAELQRSIELKQTQLENLKNLESNVKRADIQMENTLTALQTVYAQLQLVGSSSIDRGSAQRLQNQVHDQVAELQDTIAAIDEVQNYQAY